MQKHNTAYVSLLILTLFIMPLFVGCGGKYDFLSKNAIPLKIEEVNSSHAHSGDGGIPGDSGNEYQDIPSNSSGPLHPLFNGILGMQVSARSLSAVNPDATGLALENDYDGDGIPNDLELITNPFLTDYPRIVTRITTPIVMELRISETDNTENFTEVIEDKDVKETITNSMENKHYNQLNQKTTPVPTKESQSTSQSNSYSRGDEMSMGMSAGVNIGMFGANMSYNQKSASNMSIANSFSQSTMSDKTIFEDVNYSDNLDRNGVEFKNDTIQNMTKNFRQSEKTKSTYTIDPNAGYVRAGLYIKNDTVDIPVKISNVICTLAFKTSGGALLPIKTFRLRNDDYSDFEKEIYGGEELGPYALEVTGLNTHEVKQALKNGYVPQIYIVDYEVHRVEDSNYNPGVDNLKIVEETAKGRTALIKVIGTNYRDIYRVAAFDRDAQGNISPGISLKKAIFRIFSDRAGSGESWDIDSMGNELTVKEDGLKWKPGFHSTNPLNNDQNKLNNEYEYNTKNLRGNTWRLFETYIKNYVDEYNQMHRIETVKRIGPLTAYNPFSVIDNPNYNPNEFMAQEEVLKMKYWIILHNGRYFEGNINDPIWAGERYELVCVDLRDFNAYFQAYYYSPVQSQEYFTMNTSWNRLNNDGEFARAKYLGRLIKNDIVHLEMNLTESRFLFDTAYDKDTGIKNYHPLYNSAQEEIGREWYKFDYTFQPPDEAPQGIPSPFSHYVEGGFNSLKVSIDESKNAQSYEISFREKGNTSLEWKRINIRADMLTYNNNEVYINRHTRDINGNEIGFINGSLLSQGGLTYEVRARSRGLINDVELYTNSMTNGMIDAEAVVYNVDVTTNPGSDSGFTFSAAGMEDNQIYVRIGNASYTEYYKIICHGPYNYPKGDVQPPLNDDTAPVLPAIYGHPGLNKIKIANPANADKPGIYKIEVYAVNNNAERPANNEVIPVVVIHDKYAPHRDKAFAPRLSKALFDKRAIDLEVNFNDGTGWYRLKLASTDKGDKRIDCRHTSYYEYDKQKFHIFFKAPSGSQDEYSQKYAEGHDVFGGGREEAELYIRTVAEQRYRDTFWMKKQFGDDSFTENLNFIITNSGIQDFITYWSAIDISDASNIDSALVSYGVQNNGTYSEGIELKGNNISNYFFSPLEMRKYDVKVNLDEQLPSRFIYELDAPTFKTVAGDRSININEFDSMYADWYEIHYKEILDMNAPVVGLNENPLLWPLYGDVYQNNNQEYVTTLENLLPNRNYALIVVGKNGDGVVGTSKPVYYDGLKGTTKYTDAEKIWVYEATPPSVSPSIGSVSMKSDNHRMIQVDNVSYPGEVRYQIWWKRNSEPWSQASYYDTYTDNKKLEYGPVSYTITNHRGKSLEYWETYDVMARAGTIGDNWGPFSAAQSVTIGNTGGFDIGDFYWGGAFQVNTGYWFWYYPLYLNWITVPEGTVSYRITGYITEQGGTAWWAGTIYPYYIYIDQTLTPGTTWIHLGNVFSTAGGFLTDHTTTWVSVYFTITTYNDTGDTLSQSYYVDTGQGTLPWFQ